MPAPSAEALAARALRDAAQRSKSQISVFNDGFMFSCEGTPSTHTERFTGTLLIATSDVDFELEVGGRRQRLAAALLRPFLARTLHAADTPLLSIGVSPNHRAYRAFAHLVSPGCVPLPRSVFGGLVAPLARMRAGPSGLDTCRTVFDACLAAVTPVLPICAPLDPRIARVMARLADDPDLPLDALADAACLSYFRLSHLFSQEAGISLRQYLLSLKIQAACKCIGKGMSLTATAHQAGFSDSAHLSRVWAKAFGEPPSRFLTTGPYAVQPRSGTTRPPPATPPTREAAESQF